MEFQNLLSRDRDNNITGPMSPILFLNEASKIYKIVIHGAVRWWRSEMHSYDHIIVKTNYEEGTRYTLLVDMGVSGLAVGSWFNPKPDVDTKEIIFISESYKKESSPEAQKRHRENMELHRDSKENPIAVLTEKELVELFKRAEESRELKFPEKYGEKVKQAEES